MLSSSHFVNVFVYIYIWVLVYGPCVIASDIGNYSFSFVHLIKFQHVNLQRQTRNQTESKFFFYSSYNTSNTLDLITDTHNFSPKIHNLWFHMIKIKYVDCKAPQNKSFYISLARNWFSFVAICVCSVSFTGWMACTKKKKLLSINWRINESANFIIC